MPALNLLFIVLNNMFSNAFVFAAMFACAFNTLLATEVVVSCTTNEFLLFSLLLM